LDLKAHTFYKFTLTNFSMAYQNCTGVKVEICSEVGKIGDPATEK